MTENATFENTYVKYPFAPLVTAVLLLARALARRAHGKENVRDANHIAGVAAS